MTAEFTNFTKENNWCNGKIGDEYWFEAKLFDKGSSFGIGEGRVSKLHITQNGVDVVCYDRTWDRHMRPSKQVRPAYDAIMSLLENAPKRFEE